MSGNTLHNEWYSLWYSLSIDRGAITVNFNNILSDIKNNALHCVTKLTEQSISFSVLGVRFAVCDNGDNFNIYQLTSEGVFLPGSKNGKSMETISFFIASKLS